MMNLDRAIAALREEMEALYHSGENRRALEASIRLDGLIALRQRELFLRQRHEAEGHNIKKM